MSFSLGPAATCGNLTADKLDAKEVTQRFGSVISAAGDLPKSGLYFVAPPANPTAYTLPAGVNAGDKLELIHQGGGNDADIAIADLHGASVSVTLAGGSACVSLVWSGTEWYITNRASSSVAAAAAVANLPVVA